MTCVTFDLLGSGNCKRGRQGEPYAQCCKVVGRADGEYSFDGIAIEIYCRRGPSKGTPEDDWREAEAQIGHEEASRSQNLGPAKLKEREKSHWGSLATHRGEDAENPA